MKHLLRIGQRAFKGSMARSGGLVALMYILTVLDLGLALFLKTRGVGIWFYWVAGCFLAFSILELVMGYFYVPPSQPTDEGSRFVAIFQSDDIWQRLSHMAQAREFRDVGDFLTQFFLEQFVAPEKVEILAEEREIHFTFNQENTKKIHQKIGQNSKEVTRHMRKLLNAEEIRLEKLGLLLDDDPPTEEVDE